jgi:hypothetical protein
VVVGRDSQIISPMPDVYIPNNGVQAKDSVKSTLPDQLGDDYEVSIAFLPPQKMNIDLFILNDSTYRICYCAGFYSNEGRVMPFANGIVDADSKILLKTINLIDLHENPTLWLETLFLKNIEFLPIKERNAVLKLNYADFFNTALFDDNDFFETKSLVFKMLSSKNTQTTQPIPDNKTQQTNEESVLKHSILCGPKIVGKIDVEALKKGAKTNTIAPKSTDCPISVAATEEIHLVEMRAIMLRSQLGFLTEKDLHQIQMERAYAGIEMLLTKQCNACVLVYGLGSGSLKTDLQLMLNEKYPMLQWQDASQREYHYGAIMVKQKTE